MHFHRPLLTAKRPMVAFAPERALRNRREKRQLVERDARTESRLRNSEPIGWCQYVFEGRAPRIEQKAATTRPSRPRAPCLLGKNHLLVSIENIANAALPRLPCEPPLNQSGKREAASSEAFPSSDWKTSAAPNCVVAATLRPSEMCRHTELSPCSKARFRIEPLLAARTSGAKIV